MRAPSAALWRGFLETLPPSDVYTADPGAHAMARELVPLLRDMGRLGAWYTEGWAAASTTDGKPLAPLSRAFSPDRAMILGSQTNYARTQAVLKAALDARATSVFVFDHWKNFAAHFADGPLPSHIIVPDDLALHMLIDAIGERATPRVQVLPHLAIEAAVDRVSAGGAAETPGVIAILLDPVEPEDGLGYDWRSSLAAMADVAARRPGALLLVKPHPRQDAREVASVLEAWTRRGIAYRFYSGVAEELIAEASEVWGNTTIALHVALFAGKTIRSFQVGRTEAGARASTPFIEPYLVV